MFWPSLAPSLLLLLYQNLWVTVPINRSIQFGLPVCSFLQLRLWLWGNLCLVDERRDRELWDSRSVWGEMDSWALTYVVRPFYDWRHYNRCFMWDSSKCKVVPLQQRPFTVRCGLHLSRRSLLVLSNHIWNVAQINSHLIVPPLRPSLRALSAWVHLGDFLLRLPWASLLHPYIEASSWVCCLFKLLL